MTYEQILGALKKGEYKPLYFLYGKEPYFIDSIANFIEANALSESEKAFNQTILYGKEIDHKNVMDAARRYPMMAPRQVVIVKEAQEMKSLKELQLYAEKPTESTVLVICHKHKSFNINTKFGQALKKSAVVLNAKKLYDNQIPDWISKYLTAKKLKINSQHANLLAEYLGTDLSKVANELDKLAINLPAGSEITLPIIEEQIGISRAYNVFELQKALGSKDILKSNRIVNHFIANPKSNPLPMVVGALYNYFSKIYMLHFLRNTPEKELLSALELRSSFFLKEYQIAARKFSRRQVEKVIAILREYDLKSKGVDFIATGKEEGALLREMVWKILH